MLGGTAQEAAFLPDVRSQLPQGGQMHVNGPGPKLAAAGMAQLRPARAGQDGPQKHHRGAHLPHQVIGDVPPAEAACVDDQIPALPVHPAAQVAEDADARFHIAEMGAAPEYRAPRVQDGCGQNGQNAVFRALDRQGALQPAAALNGNMAHMNPSAHEFVPCVQRLIHGMRTEENCYFRPRERRSMTAA